MACRGLYRVAYGLHRVACGGCVGRDIGTVWSGMGGGGCIGLVCRQLCRVVWGLYGVAV